MCKKSVIMGGGATYKLAFGFLASVTAAMAVPVSVENGTINVAGPGAAMLSESVSGSTLAFTGGGATALEADGGTRTETSDTFLSSSFAVLFRNVSLRDVVAVSGKMAGAWITGQKDADGYFVRNDGLTLTAQLQHFSSQYVNGVAPEYYTKCIGIELRQNGADIEGRAVYARASERLVNMLGTDMSVTCTTLANNYVRHDDQIINDATLATAANVNGYGICSLTLTLATAGVTLSAPAEVTAAAGTAGTLRAPLAVLGCEHADGTVLTFDGFLTATLQRIGAGSLADVKCVRGTLGGGWVPSPQACSCWYMRRSGDRLAAQLQSYCNGYTRCVRVELEQRGGDIYGRAIDARLHHWYNHSSVGFDFDDLSDPENQLSTLAVTSNANGNGVREFRIVLKGASGAAEPQPVSVSGGGLHFYNGVLPRTFGKLYENLSLDDVVCLGGLFCGAYINAEQSPYTPSSLHAAPYHTRRDGDMLTFQLQSFAAGEEYTKGVVVELKQVGNDIHGRAVSAHAYDRKNIDARGVDFTDDPHSALGTVAAAANEPGYGVWGLALAATNGPRVALEGPAVLNGALQVNGVLEIGGNGGLGVSSCAGAIRVQGALRFTGGGKQTLTGAISGRGAVIADGKDLDLWGDNSFIGGLYVRGAKVSVKSYGALPVLGRIEVGDGGELELAPAVLNGAYNSVMGGTNAIHVGRGGTLTLDGKYVTGLPGSGERRFVVDGGTLHTKMRTPKGYHYQHENYLSNVTLKNGARIVGYPFSAGSENGLELQSSGAGTNTIESGFWLVNGDSRVALNVKDGTLLIAARVADHPSFKGHPLVKTGAGTLLLSYSDEAYAYDDGNDYLGATVIEAGTLRLLAKGAIPKASAVTLAGGTLDAGTVANTCGALTLTADSTVNVEADGEIAFADSSAAAWASGATLTLTGDLKHGRVRFGTGAAGVTAAQLRAIRFDGHRVRIDADGYIVPAPQGTVIVVR